MNFDIDDEPDTYTTVEVVYKSGGHTAHNEDPNILFEFDVIHTKTYETADSDSDGDEDLENLGTKTVRHHTLLFGKTWLIGGENDQIQANAKEILGMIHVPHYEDIVEDLTKGILDLKKPDATFVEKVKVNIHVVTVLPFPHADDDNTNYDDMDVTLAVAPASDEAVANHLKTVVVEDDEGFCVICKDKIQVVSDIGAARMPCNHVFHRTCVEEWFRRSGNCPVCRSVLPF